MTISSEERSNSQALRRRLESQMLIAQSDKKRLDREHEAMLGEIRRLKDGVKRMEIDIDEKETAAIRLVRDISIKDSEIAHIKKQLNVL